MKSNSHSFRYELFEEPRYYEEAPLRDRKAWIEYWRDEQKAEFIRDCIALANTARFLGKPAYMLLGIDDEGNKRGLDPLISRYQKNNISEHQIWERIKQDIGRIFKNYIDPMLLYEDLYHERVDNRDIAYILIPNINSDEPFHVKRAISTKDGVELISIDDCWIRFGESKEKIDKLKISVNQEPFCYSFHQAPFPLLTQWRKFFENSIGDLDRLSSTIAPEPKDEHYQDIRVQDGSLLDDETMAFLDNNDQQIFIILGQAGMGKTVFLKRFIRKLLIDGSQAIEEGISREEFILPPVWIPIYISLRNKSVDNVDHLTNEIINHINSIGVFWKTPPNKSEKIFDIEGAKWLLCFDGLDEVWGNESIRKFISILQSFSRRYSHIKIILTSRDTIANLLNLDWRAKIVNISPFSRNEILSFISSHIREPLFDEIKNYLQHNTDLWNLLSIPAYLEASLDEFAYSEIIVQNFEDNVSSIENDLEETDDMPELLIPIRTGILLDRIYKRIWNRELERGLYPADYDESWYADVGELAFRLDGKKSFIRRKEILEHLSESLLEWTINLGILKRIKNSSWITFFTELTKLYFSAFFLIDIGFEQKTSIQDYINNCTEEFKQRLILIFNEITGQSI